MNIGSTNARTLSHLVVTDDEDGAEDSEENKDSWDDIDWDQEKTRHDHFITICLGPMT